MVAAYLLLSVSNTQRLSQLVDEELTKRGINSFAIQRQLNLAEKVSNLESNMTVLHSSTESGEKTTLDDSSLTISLLGKFHELEKKINSLSTDQFLEKKIEQENNGNFTETDDPTKSQLSEGNLTSYYQSLENNFQSEDQDPQWALVMNEKIKNIIEKIRQNSNSTLSVLTMECKSTLCRLEIAYGEEDDMGMLELTLLNSLSGEIGESSSKLNNDSESNTSSIVYYFARKGHSVVRSQQNP